MSIFGLLAMGGTEIALGLDVLREVIPRPAQLEPLPAKARGLLGAVVVRDLVIPVVDISAFTGLESAADPSEQVIAILRHDGCVLGLVADGVRGVRELDPDAQLEMRPGPGGPLMFSGCVPPVVDEPLVSLLDIRTVFALPGVPAVRAADAGTTAGPRSVGESAAEGRSGARRVVMLMRCGATPLALEVTDIRSVLPTIEVLPSVLQSELCQGVTHYLGLTIAVADPLVLLGLGRFPAEHAHQGVVLGTTSGLMALLVSDIVEIVSVREDDIRPMPTFGVPRPEFFDGVYEAAGGERYLVLDARRLHDDHDLDVLASLQVQTDTAPETGDQVLDAGRSRAGTSYLVYSVGIEAVSPLEEIAEILAMPEDLLRTNQGGDGVLGLFTHRGELVPVVDLGAVLGRPRRLTGDEREARLLITDLDGQRLAFAVHGLRSIEASQWEAPSIDVGSELSTWLSKAPLVRISDPTGTGTKLVPRLSLREAIAVVTGRQPAEDHVTELAAA